MAGFGVSCSGLYTERDAHNIRIFNAWAISASLLFALSLILIGKGIIEVGPVAWALTGATVLSTILTMHFYVVFLRAADELLRKIQLEGLALGFGAGVVFMIGYNLFERLGAPEANISDPMVVMVVFWAIGQWRGLRRYAGEE